MTRKQKTPAPMLYAAGQSPHGHQSMTQVSAEHLALKSTVHTMSIQMAALSDGLQTILANNEEHKAELEKKLAQNAKNIVCASVKLSKIFLNFTMAQTVFLAKLHTDRKG